MAALHGQPPRQAHPDPAVTDKPTREQMWTCRRCQCTHAVPALARAAEAKHDMDEAYTCWTPERLKGKP